MINDALLQALTDQRTKDTCVTSWKLLSVPSHHWK